MNNVTDNHDAGRFELHVDGELAGYVNYQREGDRWSLPHTRILDRFGGRGLGHELVVGTLNQIAGAGGEVLPLCPFIPRVMNEHPEFIALVPAERRAEFGLVTGEGSAGRASS